MLSLKGCAICSTREQTLRVFDSRFEDGMIEKSLQWPIEIIEWKL